MTQKKSKCLADRVVMGQWHQPHLNQFGPKQALYIARLGHRDHLENELTEQEALRRAFGSALRSLRRKAGYSQEQLALEGFARSHVSDLERGLRDPKLSTVLQICEILSVPLAAFAHEVERNYASLTGKSLAPLGLLPTAEHLWYVAPVLKQKDASAVKLGRKGGQATAQKRTPQQRSEQARRAARKRWKKTPGDGGQKP